MEIDKEKIEKAAVNAVSQLVNAAERLADRFSTGDKLPLTDGTIDLYADARRKNRHLEHRVAVQIKGSTTNRKSGKSGEIKFSIKRDVLRFFEAEGGGIFFVGAMPKTRQNVRVYYLIITPNKAQRLLAGMTPKQETTTVRMTRVTEGRRLEDIVLHSIKGRAQAHAPQIDLNTHDMGRGIRITPLEPLSDVRPEVLDLMERDFIVEVTTAEGHWVPVDMDLTIYPESYLPREVAIEISCGNTTFDRVIAQQTGEHEGHLKLSNALTINQRWENQRGSQTVSFSTTGSLSDVVKGLAFFEAASQGEPVLIDGRPAELEHGDLVVREQVAALRRNLRPVEEALKALGVDLTALQYETLTERALADLAHLRDSLVEHADVAVSVEGVGRLDLSLGDAKAILIVAAGNEEGRKRILDPFDPANFSRFRVVQQFEDGRQELLATPYDGITVEDFRTAINLRLRQIQDAYSRLKQNEDAVTMAHRSVLNLIEAADGTDGAHRDELLLAARRLNDWVVENDPSQVHEINRLQILARQRPLSPAERLDAARIQQKAAVAHPTIANSLAACAAILLGDQAGIDVAVEALKPDELKDLKTRPIWNLMP